MGRLCLQCYAFWVVYCLCYFLKSSDKTFKPYLKKFMQVFVDDFNVYGDKKISFRTITKMLKGM
jgi:hypothetical protein